MCALWVFWDSHFLICSVCFVSKGNLSDVYYIWSEQLTFYRGKKRRKSKRLNSMYTYFMLIKYFSFLRELKFSVKILIFLA